LTVCLTAFGSIAKGREIRRNGARAGDLIYVSGTIGDATLGLKVLQDGIAGLGKHHAKVLVGRYRRPQPRVRLGLGLVGLATAAIDVSDGLIADLGHVAQTSRCSAEIDVERVPLSAAARAAVAASPRAGVDRRRRLRVGVHRAAVAPQGRCRTRPADQVAADGNRPHAAGKKRR
jgi:thiamine-monophosphate kinase